jgi:predicted PhzF superfamily epimerase YddE/YHI9
VDAAGAVVYARFFNPAVGITEDPATGTAAGPLAARLDAAGRVPDQSTAMIE